MGGAVGPGNISANAEFNVWKDPEAARIVLNAGIKKLTMVPLDATHAAHIIAVELSQLLAFIGDGASSWAQQLQQSPTCRRLSATTFTNQTQRFSLIYTEGDTINRLYGANLAAQNAATNGKMLF